MVRSLSKLVSDARPTAFHQMLATLAKEGRLMRLYTQNVDGIDTSLPPLVTSVPLSMKGPWPRTIQLHGGLEKMVCSKCNHLSDFEAALFDGPLPPPCTACMETDKVRTDHAGKRSHGIGRLRPRIVLYNEHNPDEEAIGTVVSADLRTRPDALIVVGTSMKIPGVRRMVKEMCGVIRGRKGGLTVWINHEAPGKDFGECWDLVVRGACDEVALQADMRRWDDDSPDYQSSTESEVERAKQRVGEVNVVIRSTSAVLAKPVMLTPAPSPGPDATKRPKISLKLRLPKPPTQLSDSKTANSKIGALPVKRKYISKNKSAKSTPAVSTKNHKITASYKISKPGHASIKKQNAKKAVTPSRSFPGSDEAGMPMAPISPQAARNNGPVQSPTDPNSIKAESRSSEERMKRRSEEIVSPTGTLPSGMSMLLHH